MHTGSSSRVKTRILLCALQEVTIDGKLVLRKTSPTNQRTWKKKISDWVKGRKRPKGNFQMHLVSNGFEVRLDGATIWGVYSAELPPVAS